MYKFSKEVAARYEKQQKLGEGTYAVVFQGKKVDDGVKVAIKKIKMGEFKDGLDMSAIREIKFLMELQHENVIKVHDIFIQKKNINLVLEFLEYDLEMIIKDKTISIMPSDIKSWILMTLRGVYHCHSCFVLHRDLKPNNLLIDSNGILKLADFGLARSFGEIYGNMTTQVVTRWYRAPELLFGARDYGGEIDIWAVGCILAELMLRTPFLAGESDMDQLKTIFRALGTPTEQDWPGLTKLPDYVEFQIYPKPNQRQIFTAATDETLDLLSNMLLYDPQKRISSKEALLHPFFISEPKPTHPSLLPKISRV